MEWLLELALLVLLAATLFHAIRLERALGVLKRDRAALETLVDGFNSSTRTAELGIERLRAAAEGAGRQVERQAETASGLKDDLLFLIERGERLADRLDQLVRAARPLAPAPAASAMPAAAPPPTAAEADAEETAAEPADPLPPLRPGAGPRSQAERDLLRALRLNR
jgi:hypothetical protein